MESVGVAHGGKLSFFGNGEFRPPPGRVVGVYFDKQRKIWRANWREGEIGKRKTKNFSVEDHGFEEARRLAIEYRLMKVTEIAQVELNGDEYDRIRLSTSRAPPQTSHHNVGSRNRCKPKENDQNCHMNGPYDQSRGNHSVIHPGVYSAALYNAACGHYANGYAHDAGMLNGNNMETNPNYWYSNPAVLYSLYQHHLGQVYGDESSNPYYMGDPSVLLMNALGEQPGMEPPCSNPISVTPSNGLGQSSVYNNQSNIKEESMMKTVDDDVNNNNILNNHYSISDVTTPSFMN